MLHDQPPRPANMNNIVAINQGKTPCTMEEPAIAPLEPAQAAERMAAGHAVIDTRADGAFAEAHIPGSFNVLLSSGSFEQNVGWILPGECPYLLVVDGSARAAEAARKLAFVGLDGRAAGFVEFAAWRRAGLPLSGLSRIDVDELQRKLAAGGIQVLDVREADEWRGGHIDSALQMSFKHLPTMLERLSLRPQEPVAVVCAGGMRSSTACSVLRSRGFDQVYNVDGGMQAWRRAGLPVSKR